MLKKRLPLPITMQRKILKKAGGGNEMVIATVATRRSGFIALVLLWAKDAIKAVVALQGRHYSSSPVR